MTFKSGPESSYKRLISDGQIVLDKAQEDAMFRLQEIFENLDGYRLKIPAQNWWDRFRFLKKMDMQTPRGLYIFGGVGRGKSMLMDLFFDEVDIERKRRNHFH